MATAILSGNGSGRSAIAKPGNGMGRRRHIRIQRVNVASIRSSVRMASSTS